MNVIPIFGLLVLLGLGSPMIAAIYLTVKLNRRRAT